MKVSCLEDITYYKNLPDGTLFTPINYFYRRFSKEFISDVVPSMKVLLLDKFLELLDKYEYEIELWDLENYLNEKDSFARYGEIVQILKVGIKDKSLEHQRQLMYAYEYINYGFGLEYYVGHNASARKDMYEYIDKKYPNFRIDSREDEEVFNDFLRAAINNDEDVFGDSLNKVIIDFRSRQKKLSRTS